MKHWWIFFLFFFLISSLRAEPLFFQPDDRVMILGDTLVQNTAYPIFLQQYIYTRHRNLNAHFFKQGWATDTTKALLERLERDVLIEKPTVVLIHYGISDAGFNGIDWKKIKAFTENLNQIVTTLKKKNIRLVLIGLPCCDTDRNPQFLKVDQNTVFNMYNDVIRSIALSNQILYIDYFADMQQDIKIKKQKDPTFTLQPDGLHFDTKGSLYLLNKLLPRLGCSPQIPLAELNIEEALIGHVAQQTPQGFKITLTQSAPTPFWIPENSLDLAKEIGFLKRFGSRSLTIHGLPKNTTYQVTIDQAPAGIYTAAQLDAGIEANASQQLAPKLIHEWVTRKDMNYHVAWSDVRLHYANLPGGTRILQALGIADEGFHEIILDLSPTQTRTVIELSQTK